MMKCKEATRLVSQAMDRRLSLGELMQLRLHLAMCRGCTHYRRQMLFLRQTLRRYAGGKAAPAGRQSGDA